MICMVEAIQSSLLMATGDDESPKITLTGQQEVLKAEVLEWLRLKPSKLARVTGFAGTGKTTVIKYVVQAAIEEGLINGPVWACAPTHQAKGVIENSLRGSAVTEVTTAHSLLGLRPKTVEFKRKDQDKLDVLLGIKEELRSTDESALIDALLIRRNASDAEVQSFVPSGKLKEGIEKVRFLLVDEWSMIDKLLYGLFCELANDPVMHPDFQIIFLGDPAQLPPIGETISKVESLPSFQELTEVVRYKGAILEYCNKVRTERDYNWLHQRVEEDETLMVLQEWEVMPQLKELYAAGESIRFAAATNARVMALNYQIRGILKDGDLSGLFYDPGDVVLTLNAVSRSSSYAYDVACGGKKSKLEEHTSTLLELGDLCGPGAYVSLGTSGTILTDQSFEMTSKLGTKFSRMIFRYRRYESGLPFSERKAICLLNPAQYDQWQLECKQLASRAKVTQTRSRKSTGIRGQEGEQAKAVWEEFGLKNWWKKKNGEDLQQYEYQKLKTRLWIDYFDLANFADKASYSYVSTCHRLQGVTVDIVVLDMKTLMSNAQAKFDETWDPRKLLYTAATRARKQLIFMC